VGRNIILTDQGTLEFKEGTGGGTDGVTISAPATIATAYTITLPNAQGAVDTFLKNDGSGGLTWGTSTATLDSAYDNGATITADAGQVEINGTANVSLLLNQDSNNPALDIDSEATGNPLINLAPLLANTRGDIAFGTVRTANPSTPTEGDVWYNATTNSLTYQNNSTAVSLTADTQNTLDQAYDEGGAGAGRTITADSGAVQITGSAQTLLDIDQAGAFVAVDIDQAANNDGLVVTSAGGSTRAALRATVSGTGNCCTLTKTHASNNIVMSIDAQGSGAQDVFSIFNAGSGNYIDTDAGAGTPAHLTNGGVWTDASCFKRFKRDIEPVDTKQVLEGIRKMSISRYFDKADRSENPRRRFAPFQDDLVDLFGLDDRGVSPLEVAAIALAGVKALAEEMAV
jgi:hypothetical protein